ncbi:MAG: hypothetical protein J1E06_04160 [Acutalibacter sp.]|nr:hypothetical protein [Acutalibacter sp.]
MENAIACEYLKEIKRTLPETIADRRKFLEDFEENLESYLQENPNAVREDLVHRFGSPEVIVESFLPEAPTGEVLRTEKQKKLRKRLIIAFFAICAIILIALFAYRVWDMHGFYHGYAATTGGEGEPPEDTSALVIF